MTAWIFATYNVQKCVGLDFRRDPERTARVIAGLGADVVALQEVDKRLGQRPAALPPEVIERVAGLHPVEVARTKVSIGWHGNAILVARDIEIARVVHIDLPGLEPRGAVLAELVRHGARWRVIGCHLGLRRRDRKRQLARIARAAAEAPPMATVIMGDMNEWSRRRGFEALKGYDVLAPGKSFHARRPMAALDRIAISAGVEATGMGVVASKASRIASDHLPIWAELRQAD